jgi:hypothetical protein
MKEEDIIKTLNLISLEISEYGGYYFTKEVLGNEVHGSFDGKNTLSEDLVNNIKNIYNSIDILNEKAKELIQKNYPDEDVNELILDDIIFYEDFSFSIGYPTEETAGGKEYIYVKFNKDFTMEEKLIYEYY